MVARATRIISAKDEKAVRLAAEALKKGEVVAFPTETAYGLGALATDAGVVEKVFRLKGRPRQKALPILVGDLAVIERYASLSRLARHIAEKFMPGPLSLIVRCKNARLSAVAAEDGSVAFRIPGNELARALCRAAGKPITATSANPSGKPPAYEAREVKKHFAGKVGVIVDAGGLKRTPPSTILDVRGRSPKLVRAGPVSAAAVFKEIKAFERSRKLVWRRKTRRKRVQALAKVD